MKEPNRNARNQNTAKEMKNAFVRRLDMAEEGISALEDVSIEPSKPKSK